VNKGNVLEVYEGKRFVIRSGEILTVHKIGKTKIEFTSAHPHIPPRDRPVMSGNIQQFPDLLVNLKAVDYVEH
jgi:hypothetical protein